MRKPCCPVTIRDTTYPSLYRAAKDLNVSISTIFRARNLGTLDNVGTLPIKRALLLYKLSIATPDDLPYLREQAKKHVVFSELKRKAKAKAS
jgi:hypothetical protein